MERNDFVKVYNERVKAMGALDRAECLGTIKVDGDAAIMNTRTPGVNLLYFAKEAAQGVIVSGRMDGGRATDALLVYAACIDVLMGVTEKKRNEYLEKLHLFDGRLGPKGSNLTVRGYLLEVRPGHPTQSMISYTVANLSEPMPAELLVPEYRGL